MIARDDTMKTIDMTEFAKEGYLQEINRLFLHPLGLAMYVTLDENKKATEWGIWDARDDPEGFYFAAVEDDPDWKERRLANANKIQQLFNDKVDARIRLLGSIFQPPDYAPDENVRHENYLSVDGDEYKEERLRYIWQNEGC
jgi:hypothetical protein